MKKITLVISGIIMSIILFYLISGLFLTYNNPVKSPYILLEDWISHTIVEDASNFIVENNIDSVFVVGMKTSSTSVSIQKIDKSRKLQKHRNIHAMNWGGVLGFEIPLKKLKETSSLYVKMRGTSDSKLFPHFEIFVNKQLIGTGFVTESDSVYKFILPENIPDSLTYILINFDNDAFTSAGDRNLYVSDMYIDSVNIDSISTNNFFISANTEPHINYVSKLNTIKYYLKDLGYDTSRVKLIEVDYDPFNTSLALAKGAERYFRETRVKNINIITEKKHSRRSFLYFNNCLGENIEVGCFPGNINKQEKTSLYSGIDERVSLLLTWIYCWFH